MRADSRLLYLLLGVFEVILAETSTRNADFLRGEKGLWSCTLQQQLNERCAANDDETTRRSLLTRQLTNLPDHSPSPCTCNNIYFNVWSACALTNDHTHTLPSLGEWASACDEVGSPYKKTLKLSESRLVGLWIPPWAQLPVPSDTFDVMQAVLVAQPPSEWRMVHILAPIVSCLATLVLVGIVYFVVSRNQSKGRWFGILSFLRPSLRPVRYEAPKGDWVIDHNEDARRQDGRVDLEASLPVDDFHPQANDSNHPYQGQANNSKSSSTRKVLPKSKPSVSNAANDGSISSLTSPFRPSPLDLTSTNNSELFSPPLKSKWSDTESYRTDPPPAQHARRLPGTSTFHSLVSNVRLANPFGQRPARLKHVAPNPRFRLDDYDQSRTESRKTTYDTSMAGILTNTRDTNQDAGQPVTEVEERQSLITDEDRTNNKVFLISKVPGKDFSIGSNAPTRSSAAASSRMSSHIQVISPTASSRESWKTRSQRPGEAREPPVEVPPVPRYPPPVPPSPSGSTLTYPLANVADDVDEYKRRPSASSASSKDTPQSQSPPVGLIPTPFRGYAYDPERYPPSTPSPRTMGHHQLASETSLDLGQGLPRMEIMDHEEDMKMQIIHRETQPKLLPSPPSRPVRQNSPYIPNGYHHSTRHLPLSPGQIQGEGLTPRPIHARALSASSSTSSNGGSVGGRHWRGLSEEDAGSPYFSPRSLPVHVRSLSQENLHPDRGNPELLFPPSVRAVGYSGGAGVRERSRDRNARG